MPKIPVLMLLLIPLALPCRSADVIFGRRLYAVHGHSYQQIWTLDSRTRKVAPLTHSDRRHDQAVCSPDGRRIWFLSGPFGDIDENELWWFDRLTRSETLAAKLKVRPITLVGATEKSAFFTALENDKGGLYRWDGRLEKISALDDTVGTAALSPDGRTLAVQRGKASLVTMFAASGAQGREVAGCSGPVWSSDGRRLVCFAGAKIRVMDVASGAETAHAEFTLRPTPPLYADFSPDGKRLLMGTIGANHTSTSPQLDYWTLEIAAGKWEFIGPGQAAIFAAGGVLLVTPRELAPVGKAHEWVSQILLVDPATHAQTPLAAGTASNVEPRRCLEPTSKPGELKRK